MKLYTEDQVIELTKAAFSAGQNHNSFIFAEEFMKVRPIELPSDEKIIEEILFHHSNEYAEGFYGAIDMINGAINMVKEKIKR